MTIRLQRPPLFSGRLVPFSLVTAVIAVPLISDVVAALSAGRSIDALLRSFLIAIGLLVAVAATALRRWYVRTRPDPQIVLGEKSMTVPVNIESTRTRDVPYGDLRSVAIGGVAGRLRLLLETAQHVFVLNQRDFVNENDTARLVDEVHQRIDALPEGEQILSGMAERQGIMRRSLGLRPWATQVILGVNVVFFANQMLVASGGAELSLIQHWRWGAVVGPLVREGEVYRLVAANFLHGNLLHVGLNMFFLYLLGSIVERLIGHWRFLVVYLGAGLAATSSSAMFLSAPGSLGASGALFGILGALALANLRFGKHLPLGFRQPPRVWILLAVINIALPAILPFLLSIRIDVVAHVAGFIAGGLIAQGLYWSADMIAPRQRSGPVVRGVAVGLVVIFVIGLGVAVQRAAAFDEAKRDEYVSRLFDYITGQEDVDAASLNMIAWTMAIDPEAGTQALTRAREAAARAVEVAPDEPAIRDTLATTLYRTGDFQRAVEEQDRVMRAAANATYATQIARFIDAARDQDVPLGGRTSNVTLELTGESAQLTVEGSTPQGLMVYAPVYRQDNLVGLLSIRVGPNPPSTPRISLAPWPDLQKGELTLVAGYASEPGPESAPSGEVQADYYPAEREILQYP